MSDEIATLKTKVVTICQAHEKENWSKWDYRACVLVGQCYFVKYGNADMLEPEIATQRYIFHCAKLQSDTTCVPRIPEIKYCFQEGPTMYLVMERITLTASPPDFIERLAKALKWLSEVKPPPGHVIGPLGGGCIRHEVFQDFKAPLQFWGVDALERYLRAAHRRLSPWIRSKVSPITIKNDRLMFTQSDMDLSNFGVDEQDRTVLMDFGDVGLLPETLIAYTMSTCNRSLAPVAKALGLSHDSNASMARIHGFLGMVSDPILGLDEDGFPVTKEGKNRPRKLQIKLDKQAADYRSRTRN